MRLTLQCACATWTNLKCQKEEKLLGSQKLHSLLSKSSTKSIAYRQRYQRGQRTTKIPLTSSFRPQSKPTTRWPRLSFWHRQYVIKGIPNLALLLGRSEPCSLQAPCLWSHAKCRLSASWERLEVLWRPSEYPTLRRPKLLSRTMSRGSRRGPSMKHQRIPSLKTMTLLRSVKLISTCLPSLMAWKMPTDWAPSIRSLRRLLSGSGCSKPRGLRLKRSQLVTNGNGAINLHRNTRCLLQRCQSSTSKAINVKRSKTCWKRNGSQAILCSQGRLRMTLSLASRNLMRCSSQLRLKTRRKTLQATFNPTKLSAEWI